MESKNLRDVQRLTNQILSESSQAEEHFMDSWPYTAPYLEEQQAQMRSNVTDALPWNRNTKYTTQGKLRQPGENVHGKQTGRGLNRTTTTMGAKPPKRPLANPGPMKNSSNAELGTKRSHPGAPGSSLGWNRLRKEEATDLFDVLSEFLVSEGYSEQESLEMMAIMTEEQRSEILDFLESMASASRMGQIRRDGIKTPGSAADYRSRGGSVQHMGRDIKPADKPNPAMSTSKRPSTAADFRRRGGSVQHMGRDITKKSGGQIQHMGRD